MRIRGASSENAPEPISAALWKSQVAGKKHGLGYAVERTNGEWSKPHSGAKRSFESAMNYLFSEGAPMSEEMGEFEGRAH